jgi:Methyltransferase domain
MISRTGRLGPARGDVQHPRREARRNLLELMPKASVCAEIGVWKGNFSKKILNRVQPSTLHLIDPWKFVQEEGYELADYGGKVAKSQADMDGLFERVRERFADEISRGVVHIHRATSTEAGATFPDDYLDWVYIDANHSYEFVRDDLLLFHVKVKPGGYLTGDDYGIKGWWGTGVKDAVDEFVAQGKGEWVLQERGQFVLRNRATSR